MQFIKDIFEIFPRKFNEIVRISHKSYPNLTKYFEKPYLKKNPRIFKEFIRIFCEYFSKHLSKYLQLPYLHFINFFIIYCRNLAKIFRKFEKCFVNISKKTIYFFKKFDYFSKKSY